MPATSDHRFAGRLVLLHGFTQTHHHLHPLGHLVADRLANQPTLAFVELPGHGLASHDVDGDITTSGARLARLAGPGTYIGYSMGGRMALLAAIARPDAVERLVLIGATAGIDDADERAARGRADDELADRIVALGVDAFLDEWLAAPLFATLPANRAGLDHRRRNTAAGLAHSLRRYGTGAMGSHWDALATLDTPVLVVVGELDAKFTAIGRRLVTAIPGAVMTTIAGTGHAAHAERPDDTADAIVRWLRDTER